MHLLYREEHLVHLGKRCHWFHQSSLPAFTFDVIMLTSTQLPIVMDADKRLRRPLLFLQSDTILTASESTSQVGTYNETLEQAAK